MFIYDVVLFIWIVVLIISLYPRSCPVPNVIDSVSICNVVLSKWVLVLSLSLMFPCPYGHCFCILPSYCLFLISLVLTIYPMLSSPSGYWVYLYYWHVTCPYHNWFSWCCPVHIRIRSIFIQNAVLFLWQYILCISLTLYCPHIYFHGVISFIHMIIPWLSLVMSCLCGMYYCVYLEVSFCL